MQFRKRLCDEGLQSYGHFCAQVQSKLRKSLNQALMKKANHLTRFNDLDHQNRNFMVSIMVVSFIF